MLILLFYAKTILSQTRLVFQMGTKNTDSFLLSSETIENKHCQGYSYEPLLLLFPTADGHSNVSYFGNTLEISIFICTESIKLFILSSLIAVRIVIPRETLSIHGIFSSSMRKDSPPLKQQYVGMSDKEFYSLMTSSMRRMDSFSMRQKYSPWEVRRICQVMLLT